MMQFEYSGAPQRSPEWYKIRIGKIGASRLEDWLSVSKAKATTGKPLKARLDYEKELMFERQFGVNFDNYFSQAMQDGIELEDFARRQYEKIRGVVADECGCWYSGVFVASPDRVIGADGLLEIKVLRDNSFTEVLISGVPAKHWKQIQGQLWASKRAWCDYVAINLSTKKIKIIRLVPDPEFHEYLELAVLEDLVTAKLDVSDVYDFVDAVPEGVVLSGVEQTSNNSSGDWSK